MNFAINNNQDKQMLFNYLKELDNHYRLKDRLDLDDMCEKDQKEMEEKFGQKEKEELNESYKQSLANKKERDNK